MPDVHLRLILYKRISGAASRDELREMQVELIDRFGLLPEAARNLMRIAAIKRDAAALEIEKIDASATGGYLIFGSQTSVDPMPTGVDDIEALASLQLQILTALWPMLKPHGILVYATCSVLPEENEHVVARFMQQHDDVKILPIEADWGIVQTMGRQLFPQPQGHDGFYYARIQKQAGLVNTICDTTVMTKNSPDKA